jgi:geranylgeranyl diphosphate synthase type II
MAAPDERYEQLRALINERLRGVIGTERPASLYEPARYALETGGKRIRPILVLLACEASGGDPAAAVDAGVAVEILHNFTLVHDDIMDNADQRRGRATVHRRWDANTAILVGDALIGVAYEVLLRSRTPRLGELAACFTRGMIDVCEGQSYDKDFELRAEVTLDEYFEMIHKKTGRLVAMSAELGAIIGGSDDGARAALVAYAEHLGRAFQIRDDLLDAVADERRFGKAIGGDILEGKKTFLLVTACERATGADRELLRRVALRQTAREGLVEEVTRIYGRLGVFDAARDEIRRHTGAAVAALAALESGNGRAMLDWPAGMLLDRAS